MFRWYKMESIDQMDKKFLSNIAKQNDINDSDKTIKLKFTKKYSVVENGQLVDKLEQKEVETTQLQRDLAQVNTFGELLNSFKDNSKKDTQLGGEYRRFLSSKTKSYFNPFKQ